MVVVFSHQLSYIHVYDIVGKADIFEESIERLLNN